MSTITTTTDTSHIPSVTLKDDDNVRTSFNYWGTADLPDVSEVGAVFNGGSKRVRAVPCTVTNIRTEGLKSFNLSTHGFQVLEHSSSVLPPQSTTVPDFHDADLVKSTYWPELITAVKAQLGVRSAAALNTTVRDVIKIERELNHLNPRANPNTSFQPFHIVHGDYTAAGARGHLRAMLPTFFEDNENMVGTTPSERELFMKLQREIIEAEDKAMSEEGVSDPWEWSGKNYAGPRWAILSMWRPFETVHRDPLAVMDPRTLFREGEERPYVPFTREYRSRPGFVPTYKSENLMPRAPEEGESHKWYYISEQKPEEMYALKLFDSEAHKEGSQVAYCAAHSAFQLPGQEDRASRRSAEVRVFVIW